MRQGADDLTKHAPVGLDIRRPHLQQLVKA